jgi:hypothetical protein
MHNHGAELKALEFSPLFADPDLTEQNRTAVIEFNCKSRRQNERQQKENRCQADQDIDGPLAHDIQSIFTNALEVQWQHSG